MKRKVLSFLLLFALISGLLSGCGTSCPDVTEPPVSEIASDSVTEPSEEPVIDVSYTEMAGQMLEQFYRFYWVEDDDGAHFRPIHAGELTDNLTMIWETAMLMLAMENYYHATGDEATKEKIAQEWDYLQRHFGHELMVSNCGGTPNLAADDTAWSALLYISVYRVLGDETALEYTKEVILNAYDYYKDGDIANGMWYCDERQYGGDQWKSLYCAGFLLAALEYCEITEGTDKYSQELYDQTMALYAWMEENLRRSGSKTFENGLQNGQSYTVSVNDGLYWCDYNWDRDGRDERFGPDGGLRPQNIYFCDSVSFLFGNMAMAAVNVKLHEQSGEQAYLDRAMETAQSIVEVYTTKDGTYLNDRDINTNAAALYYYVTYVLSSEAVPQGAKDQLATTATVIYDHCREENAVYFSYDWIKDADCFTTNFITNATTASMVCGAAYAEQLGILE